MREKEERQWQEGVFRGSQVSVLQEKTILENSLQHGECLALLNLGYKDVKLNSMCFPTGIQRTQLGLKAALEGRRPIRRPRPNRVQASTREEMVSLEPSHKTRGKS